MHWKNCETKEKPGLYSYLDTIDNLARTSGKQSAVIRGMSYKSARGQTGAVDVR